MIRAVMGLDESRKVIMIKNHDLSQSLTSRVTDTV